MGSIEAKVVGSKGNEAGKNNQAYRKYTTPLISFKRFSFTFNEPAI